MEMYNEGIVDNTAMIGGTNVPIEPPSLDQHPELKRIRRFLLIFIGIDLVLCVVNFLFVIHSYAASDLLENQSPHSNIQLTSVIIGLIYYGFGLLVTYRYYQTGLLVYATLGLVSLVSTTAVIVVILIRIIYIANREGFVSAGLIVAIIFDVIFLLVLILQILIVRYAFKLHLLLKRNKRLTIEQI